MEILKVQPKGAQLCLSIEELSILTNAFNIVYNCIKCGFHARLGVERDEFKTIWDLVVNLIANDKFEEEFSIDALFCFNNVLNEVCNGIKIDDFEATIGEKEKAKTLLKSIHDLFVSISPPKKNIYYSSNLPKKIIVKKTCCLETQGYKVYFYLRTIKEYPRSVGLIVGLVIDNEAGEILFKTNPQQLLFSTLDYFIQYLEEHLDSLKKNPETESPKLFFNKDPFLVQALSGTVISDQEGFFNLSFQIRDKEQNKGDIIAYVGGLAEVSFQNVQSFTSSFREALLEISFSE